MKLDTPGTAPKKWMDGNQVVFQAWREGAPWKNETYLCATMQSSKQEDPEKYGTWVNNHCTEWTKLPVCKRPALSGPITPPPDVPDIPPKVTGIVILSGGRRKDHLVTLFFDRVP